MTHSRRARALWTTAPGCVEIREEELPPVQHGQVLIETLFSGISRGTESLVFAGRVPTSERERMRAPFQVGDFPGPLKYGYANVGRVIAGDDIAAGSVVFTLFPHQTHFVIDAQRTALVPQGVPALRAVLAANMETALNAIWDARPLPGDRITIVGAGVLGCLILALLSRYPALDLEVVEVLPERGELVSQLGGRQVSAADAAKQRDLVIHTSASARGLETALELCRPEAKLVELSWYGSEPVSVPLGGAFHSQRLQLIGSQVGRVSPNKPGWSHAERMNLALRLLDDARLDALLAPPLPFEDLVARFGEALTRGLGSPAPGLAVWY